MERIYIKQIQEHIGEQVKIAGFTQTIRDQGNIKFLLIRDITGVIQVVVTKHNPEALNTSVLRMADMEWDQTE